MNLFTYMYNYNKRQQFCITSTGSTEVQKAASKIAAMFYPRAALITLILLRAITFINCFRCDVSHPEENCLTLWTAFQNSLVSQHNNLLRIDLMFNQPSRLTPTVVKVIYNYSITGLDDCNSTCVDSNCSVVLGWTAKSLYRYFHVSVINQLQFQLPFLIMKYFESNELEEEPDVDDYLWVGDNQTSLPELYLTLNVTFTPENNTLDGCPSNEDIINALGELNHRLRAFAKVALQGTEDVQNVDPDYKGYTLPQSGVQPYNYHESNKDPNEALGQNLFLTMYIANAVTAYVFGYFLYQLLLEVYDSEVERDKDFSFPPQFITVTFLASVYIGALYLTDIIYYGYNWNNDNIFIVLKVIVMTIPVMLYVLFNMYDTLTCMSNTKAPCFRLLSFFWNMIFTRKGLVRLLTLAIVLIILSVFPTLLLFFAHPLNTFTLLVIHVALFYTETITGMLVLKQCCKCEHNQGSSTEQSKRSDKLPSMAHNRQENKGGEISTCTCNTLCGVVLAIGVIIVYGIGMWFYLILFLRSLINNLAFKYFIKYIPGVIIAVFGYMYLVQKGTFSAKKKEDENEKGRQKSEKSSNNSDDHSDTLTEEDENEKGQQKSEKSLNNSDDHSDTLTDKKKEDENEKGQQKSEKPLNNSDDHSDTLNDKKKKDENEKGRQKSEKPSNNSDDHSDTT